MPLLRWESVTECVSFGLCLQSFWSTSSPVRLCAPPCSWWGCVTRGKPCSSAGWVKAETDPGSPVGGQLMYVCLFAYFFLCFSCVGSCCLESSSGHRPPSLTAVLHTKPKMTGWVEDRWWTEVTRVRVGFTPLFFSTPSAGQHLDSHRPARPRQPPSSVPGEVQVRGQVRAGRSVRWCMCEPLTGEWNNADCFHRMKCSDHRLYRKDGEAIFTLTCFASSNTL